MRRLLLLSSLLCVAMVACAAVAMAATLGPLPAAASPGQVCRVPIVLDLGADQADRMAFSLSVTPNGDAPPLAVNLAFTTAPGIPAPGVLELTTGSVVAAWFSPMTPRTGSVPLGNLRITFPAGAVDGQSYTVHMVSVGASLGSIELTTTPGPDVLASVLGPYTLTVTADPPEGGAVTGGGTYIYGTVAPVTAAASSGWVFRGWTGPVANPNAPSTTVTVTATATATAHFVQTWFEDDDPAITYLGTWTNYPHAAATDGHAKVSAQLGAEAQFTFTGTAIYWHTAKGPMLGKAQVYLDGKGPLVADLYRSSLQTTVLSKTGLTAGAHTIRIRVSGQKNPLSTGTTIPVDAFETVP